MRRALTLSSARLFAAALFYGPIADGQTLPVPGDDIYLPGYQPVAMSVQSADLRRTSGSLAAGATIAVWKVEAVTPVEHGVVERGKVRLRLVHAICHNPEEVVEVGYGFFAHNLRTWDQMWPDGGCHVGELLLCVLVPDAVDGLAEDWDPPPPAKDSPNRPKHWAASRVEPLKAADDPIVAEFEEVARLFALTGKPGEFQALIDAAGSDHRQEVREYIGDTIVGRIAKENRYKAYMLEESLLADRPVEAKGPATSENSSRTAGRP